MTSSRRPFLAALAASLVLATPAHPQEHEPDLQWRTLTTQHFWVHFPAGFEELGEKVAQLAEEAYEPVSRSLNYHPPKTHVVVHTRSDGDGSTSILPFRMEISASMPQANWIGSRDEWLRMVITHEFTHVVQLRKHRGLTTLTKPLLGEWNVGWAGLVPEWFNEGFAVLNETRFTRGGRGRNPYHLMRMPGRPLAGEPRPLGNTSFFSRKRLPLDMPYVSGYHLSQSVNARYGEDAWAGMLDRFTSFPLLGFGRAVKSQMGKSQKLLYREMLAELEAPAAARQSFAPPPRVWLAPKGIEDQLTPRWRGADRLVVYRVGFDELPELAEIDRAGRHRRIHQRWLAFSDHNFAVGDSLLVWSEYRQHPRFSATLTPELRVYELATGVRRTVLRGAQLLSLDLSPEETEVVAVHRTPPTTQLVRLRLRDARVDTLLKIERSTLMNPRWSRDGQSIAFVLNDSTGRQDIAVYHLSTGRWRYLYAPDAYHDADPCWSADGGYVLYASDRSGKFDIWAVSLATGERWQVTDAELGAFMPDVSPDGGELAFSAYTSTGFVAATMALDASRWRPEAALKPNAFALAYPEPDTAAPIERSATKSVPLATSPYRPWSQILRPQGRVPSLSEDESGKTVGFLAVSGDALHRHAWFGTFLISPKDGRPSVDFAYTYSRWWPALELRAFYLPESESTPGGKGWMREQGAELTAAVPLVLERNVDLTFLRPFVGLKIEDRNHSAGVVIPGAGRYRGVQAGVGLSRSAWTWRGVVPRRGVDILAAADWSSERFLSSEFDAWQVSSLANLFVPTPVRHHQLQFLGMYQQRRGGFDHDFFEAVPFGYDDDHQPQQLRLRAAYHFPVAYLEWVTPLLPLYLDYLAGTVFYDWGTGWDRGATGARWTEGGHYSTGLRLLLGWAFINPYMSTHLGVALYYHSGDGAVRLESQAGVGGLF